MVVVNIIMYIDKIIIPNNVQDIVYSYNYDTLYEYLYKNTSLRHQILNFHKSLVRMSNINQDIRKNCANKIKWQCGIKCIPCNVMVDLLNYTKNVKSYFRFLYNIALEVNNKIDYWTYKFEHRGDCCPITKHPIINSNIKQIVCAYLNPRTKLGIIYKYGEINTWDVSGVTNMYSLFNNCKYISTFNDSVASWNVSQVTNMSYMFDNASSYNQPLASWNVSQVTNMSYMFDNASSYNQSLASWNVSSVTNMSYMFDNASSYNQPLASWNVSQVTNMSYMFDNASSYNQPLASWNVSKVVSNYDNFATNSPLCSHTLLPKAFININVCDNIIKDSNIKGIISNYFGSEKAQMIQIYGPISNWNVSRVTNMDNLFKGQTTFNDPLASWNVSIVTNMSYMFDKASSYNQSLTSWNVSQVTNYDNFATNSPLCSHTLLPKAFININVCDNIIIDSNIQKIISNYFGSEKAQVIRNIGPISNWNVSRVTNMDNLFKGQTTFNDPLASWNVSKVKSMSSMFAKASSYNQPLASWNVSSVTNYDNFATNSPLCSHTLLPKAFININVCDNIIKDSDLLVIGMLAELQIWIIYLRGRLHSTTHWHRGMLALLQI